jgi:phenylacetate-coenzyme A ligase PaaK-like adenylate-forming protein
LEVSVSEADYDAVAQRQQAVAAEQLKGGLDRLDWSRDQLGAYRESRLREILQHASQQSAWHRERLRGIDLGAVTEANLGQLPTMTKSDLMSHWDAIATNGVPTLERCEEHLDSLSTPSYLDDRFHVVASGGSSGKRGVFVYDWEGWARYYSIYARWMLRRVRRGTMPVPSGLTTGVVAAYALTHPTVAMSRTFTLNTGDTYAFPVTLPLEDIVAGLNDLQPDVLVGYASVVGSLAHEAEAGRLSISPGFIMTTSEPMLTEMADSIERAFGTRPVNIYGTADAGIVGMGCGEGVGMHLTDDELIIEPVDANGRPVLPGDRAAKLFVTVLFQRALPLIRYELTDEVELIDEPCPCGSNFRRIRDIQGRLDDTFFYAADIVVHPHVFRSHLSRAREISEYQVNQTPEGAHIRVVTERASELGALAGSIEADLRGLGVSEPVVHIERVGEIARQGVGKLKRFVPLPAAGAH